MQRNSQRVLSSQEQLGKTVADILLDEREAAPEGRPRQCNAGGRHIRDHRSVGCTFGRKHVGKLYTRLVLYQRKSVTTL